MSHAVVRERQNLSQEYLDQIIDGVLQQTQHPGTDGTVEPRSRASVTISEILFYCFRQRPSAVFMTNAFTGECFTNEVICRRSVSLARALIATGASDKTALVVMRNSEHMAAVYYGLIFARVLPLMLEPGSTTYEIRHFLDLVEPAIVFCDEDPHHGVVDAVEQSQRCSPTVLIANRASAVEQFVGRHSDDVTSFQISIVPPESSVMLLPTSGSTGLPKASLINHQGLVAQLPNLWTHHLRFPSPTALVALLSTPQWMTHTLLMTTCPVYQVPLVMTPLKSEVEHILDVFETYRPSWTLVAPSFLLSLASVADPSQLLSVETVILTGSPLSQDLRVVVQSKFPKSSQLVDGYGMTEVQSFASLQDPETPSNSIGKIFNIFNYKIVDEAGREVEPQKTGELYLKSDYCVFKGYFKNEAAYRECIAKGGWLRTGDLFYEDQQHQLYFVARKKFVIKYFNHQICPEEVERVIESVPGVQESVVCGTELGVTAAVIVLPGHSVTREQIHLAVDSNLSSYKRVRGGVYFVERLPRTASGKVLRGECAKLLNSLLE